MKKFKSTSTADLVPELPQELIGEVLLRPPARSIGRFRCVSKPWRSLLSTSKFAKSHLNFHLHRATTPAIILLDEALNLLTFPAGGSCGRSREVTYPFSLGGWLKAACHGFVLVVNRRHDCMYVFNPVTFEYFEFEFPRFEDVFGISILHMYGMGYDCCSDDYKIVQISIFKPYSDSSDVRIFSLVNVYSMKRKCWRRLASSPNKHGPLAAYDGTYMNGYLHWVVIGEENGDYVILAFNLAREEFEQVPLPKDFGEDRKINPAAVVLRECLAIVCQSSDDCTHVWLMKEYGVQESWHKLVISTHQGTDYLTVSAVVFLSDEDEFLLVVHYGDFRKLVAYSLITGIWRDIVVKKFHGALTFKECFLSLDDISETRT